MKIVEVEFKMIFQSFLWFKGVSTIYKTRCFISFTSLYLYIYIFVYLDIHKQLLLLTTRFASGRTEIS